MNGVYQAPIPVFKVGDVIEYDDGVQWASQRMRDHFRAVVTKYASNYYEARITYVFADTNIPRAIGTYYAFSPMSPYAKLYIDVDDNGVSYPGVDMNEEWPEEPQQHIAGLSPEHVDYDAVMRGLDLL